MSSGNIGFVGRTSVHHQNHLATIIEKLRSEGYIVINLQRKSPDAIAVKDGRVSAVEVLPEESNRVAMKQLEYSMFDNVVFSFYNPSAPIEISIFPKRRSRHGISASTARAMNILNPP